MSGEGATAGHEASTPLLAPFLGDGRPLLLMAAGSLALAGGFLLFLAAAGELLPHDLTWLGMGEAEVRAIAGGRVFEFMVHDRAAFGGTILGIGVLYAWLVVFPLSAGEEWAWWALLASGTVGFLSFLAYLGYGYLDTWHGLGTLLLLPIFAGGLWLNRRWLPGPADPRSLLRNGAWLGRDRLALGRSILVLGAGAVVVGGLMILRVGVGDTFVPEDLEFMGVTAAQLEQANPRLIPLLAHDRAGFGGGVVTMGLTTLLCLWCAGPSRSLHQAVALAGACSLGPAIYVHLAVGYTDLWHLVPALAALGCLVVGLVVEHPGVRDVEVSTRRPRAAPSSAGAAGAPQAGA
jgi:hypothetical protein